MCFVSSLVGAFSLTPISLWYLICYEAFCCFILGGCVCMCVCTYAYVCLCVCVYSRYAIEFIGRFFWFRIQLTTTFFYFSFSLSFSLHTRVRVWVCMCVCVYLFLSLCIVVWICYETASTALESMAYHFIAITLKSTLTWRGSIFWSSI